MGGPLRLDSANPAQRGGKLKAENLLAISQQSLDPFQAELGTITREDETQNGCAKTAVGLAQ
uniref:hypothetical protein n=1 Tax=Methylomonas sp. PHL2-19 TaxID=3438878 RepID=UPI00402B4DBB